MSELPKDFNPTAFKFAAGYAPPSSEEECQELWGAENKDPASRTAFITALKTGGGAGNVISILRATADQKAAMAWAICQSNSGAKANGMKKKTEAKPAAAAKPAGAKPAAAATKTEAKPAAAGAPAGGGSAAKVLEELALVKKQNAALFAKTTKQDEEIAELKTILWEVHYMLRVGAAMNSLDFDDADMKQAFYGELVITETEATEEAEEATEEEEAGNE